MRAGLLAALAGVIASCGDDSETGPPPSPPRFGAATVEELLAEMTLEEKVDQMHGLGLATVGEGLWSTVPNERLAIPALKMVDGPRGVRAGSATAFPVGMARGATWDPALERRVGEAIGREAAAKGASVILAPTINILRHPAWGRAQETYGEDTVHIGELGVAFIEGAQEHVLASVKHFAANSIEDTRFEVDVAIDERSLREIYLPHFRRAVVDAHVGSVMSAYNSVNGSFCSENAVLLRDILKREWAFDGFVESDWVFGVQSTAAAARAGLDIEMPAGSFFGLSLADAVRNGDVDEAVIDEAVTRILRKKIELGKKLDPPLDPGAVESDEHVALAREVATRAMVLLKNEPDVETGVPPLPLPAAAGSIVVVGGLATVANLGDTGSSNVTPTQAVTPLQGIETRAGARSVVHISGPTLSAADLTTLAAADVTIVIVGLTTEEEGEGAISEGGDRETLGLPPEQDALIASVAAAAPKTIVVLEGGSAIVVRPWVDDVDALLMAWYPGMQGGNAIADVLFGDAAPGGRLPISFPRSAADLPAFDHTSPAVTYGFLHGYRYLDTNATEPEFPFGFGLSYTTFSYGGLEVDVTPASDGEIHVSLNVTNDGDREGDEVVQLYVRVDDSSYQRAPRDLRGFARVHLAAGETRPVAITLRKSDLAVYDVDVGSWVVEPATYTFEVAASSRDVRAEAQISIE